MIPNMWYVILSSKEVKPGRMIAVRRFGENLVAWRTPEGALSLFSDRCPHRGVAFSGKTEAHYAAATGKNLPTGGPAAARIEGGCLHCPFHGFAFEGSGRCRTIPANGRNAETPRQFKAHAWAVREAHGFVYAWYGEARDEYPPLPWFEAIGEGYATSTFFDPWATHYSRTIENQLDVVHLPFIHHNTIGRGHATLVNGPVVRLEARPGGHDLMNLWVKNEQDRGQNPVRAADLPVPDRHPFLQFLFPNLWHNWITDKLRLVGAFVPVDDGHMMLYLQTRQKFLTAPVLRWPVDRMLALMNLVIERQDKRVVETQQPKRSDLKGGEQLIPGDGPIIEYRRRRQSLIDAARKTV